MKKLLFAIVGAASFAALAADPTPGANDIDVLGFENFNLTDTEHVTGAVVDRTDSGVEGTSKWSCSGDDASLVKPYGGDNATAPSITEPAPFAGETNTKYLALDTNGSELQRAIPAAGQTVAADGTYVDTLVQFTATEDGGAPELDAADKLAIWLGVVTNAQGEVTGTNLMVRAKAWSWVNEEINSAPVDFVIANSPVVAGEWYRLTVKAVQSVVDPNQMIIPAFQIYIDGTAVAATTSPISTDLQTVFATGGEASIWMEGMADLAAANKLFPTLAEDPQDVTDVTLQGVGFQGTGAVDEIVWTEDDLFPAGGPTVVDYTFTLTLDANVTGAEVTTNGAAVVFDNGEAQILAGTTVSIAEPTFAQGYKLNTITTNETAVVSPTFPITFTMDAAMAVAITSEQIPVTYPTYVGDDATLRTKYDAWKNAYQADTQSQWESAFLLNMDPTASVAEGTALLKIASITEVSGGWELEIVSDATTLTATDGTVLVGNGYLRIIAADTLAGLTTATPSYINVAVTNGKITVTVPASNGKFMKAELTTQAPAQN